MLNNKSSPKGLFPLFTFLFIYFLCGILFKDFSVMPLLVAMILAFLITLLFSPQSKRDATIQTFCKGSGQNTIMMMVIIYILSGAFAASISAIHGSDLIAINSMLFLPKNLILPGVFLIGVILSFSMGSSMGAATALMPVALSIAEHSSVSIALVCGIVISGVIAGDNLSFISDTTVASSTVTGTKTKDKCKESLCFFAFPAIITLFILIGIPVNCTVEQSVDVSILNLLPIIAVIILSVKGMPVIPVLAIGIVLSFAIGYAEGLFTVAKFLALIHTGIMNLEEMSLIAIAAGGLIALAQERGGIDWICTKISKASNSSRFGKFSIAIATIILDIATANNTMAILTCGPIAASISDEQNISKSETSAILGYFSTITNGIVPYAGHLMTVSGLSGISPVAVIPYVYYDLIGFLTGFLWLFVEPEKYIAFLKKKEE
ncbi:MAG: hypothetical protein LKE48_08820 [Solobacterium sp.]|jgi:Na+/H+ antiporter NhaC|nr:hypothetical protein [Solobacterium sp.]